MESLLDLESVYWCTCRYHTIEPIPVLPSHTKVEISKLILRELLIHDASLHEQIFNSITDVQGPNALLMEFLLSPYVVNRERLRRFLKLLWILLLKLEDGYMSTDSSIPIEGGIFCSQHGVLACLKRKKII